MGSCSSKLEKMPSIPEEPEQAETEAECFTMPDFLKPLHNLDVVESKEAVLECQVAGLPYPSITWFHNGTRIDSTDDRKMMQCRAPRCPSRPLGVPLPGAEEARTPWEEASPPRPSRPVRQGGELCAAWLVGSYLYPPIPPQIRMSIAWCSQLSAMRMPVSIKVSLPTKWGRPRATRISTSPVSSSGHYRGCAATHCRHPVRLCPGVGGRWPCSEVLG